ncbi:Hypothetical predicted protein [Mytilus galloprovincialis]|uniref:Uncharacterized protein n=1 Tax=Mytilus galloprovincialis TaxID=29158 RepID=A0A8B6FJQ7_MYTGA|nr:Hypothetical predicted protein [Mytilus galloprovincialis]
MSTGVIIGAYHQSGGHWDLLDIWEVAVLVAVATPTQMKNPCGWLTERLKNDLIWNRTVNYRGGQSNNIEMDMMNEFLNREFKDRIDSAASALTPDVLKRHSILAGGKGNDIDKIFQYRVFSRSADYHGSGKKRNNTVDIIYFVELLQKEKLVQPMGCRNFSSHPELIHQINIKSPLVLVKNSLTLYQT